MRRFSLSLGILAAAALMVTPAQANETNGASENSEASEKIMMSPDDGTYKTQTVTTEGACNALCQSDSKCRGAVAYQADIRINSWECRLNDGMSQTSPFQVTPPKELDLQTAVADLNSYRAQHGLAPVKLNDKLNKASEIHAKDLAKHGIAAHVGTDGSTHGERVQRQAYYFSTAAENVATGQKSWDAVFKAWQDSPGHNANLLADGVVDFGIALVYEPSTVYATYWAMLVAAPMPSFSHARHAITPAQKTLLDAQERAGK